MYESRGMIGLDGEWDEAAEQYRAAAGRLASDSEHSRVRVRLDHRDLPTARFAPLPADAPTAFGR